MQYKNFICANAMFYHQLPRDSSSGRRAIGGPRLPLRWTSALGDVTPRRAALLTDDWGDERSVWIDFERADGEVRSLAGDHTGINSKATPRGTPSVSPTCWQLSRRNESGLKSESPRFSM